MTVLRFVPVLAIVVLLAASASTLATTSDSEIEPFASPGSADPQSCAPPCGYIWPRIGVHTEVPSPYKISEVREFPREVDVDITYSWDMEQEGTGITDPTEEMEILIIVSRTPAFMDAELDRNTCSFLLLPVQSEYDVCTITMTVDVDEERLPRSEEELRKNGHRLMLFAASEESGTFMKSYGLEDIRFKFDELPGQVTFDPVEGSDDSRIFEAPAPVAPLLVVALASVLVAARLRRRAE